MSSKHCENMKKMWVRKAYTAGSLRDVGYKFFRLVSKTQRKSALVVSKSVPDINKRIYGRLRSGDLCTWTSDCTFYLNGVKNLPK